MADSLLFDGTDDGITCALGGTAFSFGPGTLAAIVKRGSISSYDMIVTAGTSGIGYGMWISFVESDLTLQCDGGTPSSPISVLDTDGWVLVAISKASGTVVPRGHKYVYDTTTWTHADSDSGIANSSVPSGNAYVGQRADGHPFEGNILIAGVWNTVLSDSAVEALATGYQAWVDAEPREAWLTDTLSPINAFGLVGTADETARTGTSVDVGDVPIGWAPVSDAVQLTPRRAPMRFRRGG